MGYTSDGTSKSINCHLAVQLSPFHYFLPSSLAFQGPPVSLNLLESGNNDVTKQQVPRYCKPHLVLASTFAPLSAELIGSSTHIRRKAFTPQRLA